MKLAQIADTPTYLEARQSVAAELPDSMRTWSLATMIAEVRGRVDNEESQNRLRSFTRNVLKLQGTQHKRIGAWLRNPTLLTADDARIVLRALADLSTRALPAPLPAMRQEATDFNRKLRGYIITTINSLDALTAGAIEPRDFFDGDRMNIRASMERLCARFGITATFSDPSAALNKRVRSDELG
jgi:hypothetical protein